MTSAELRRRFLSFFESRGHAVVPSDSLIPSGDPTVLFTSAGMNQFKDYFLGKRTDLARAASCQKCLRTGDLDQVGRTPSHHSFFEMLGNFSFGDYFKREAIQWAWEFLTGTEDAAGKQKSQTPELCLSLSGERVWVSLYEQDDEAFALWRTLGLPESRIKRFGQADNFWPANAPRQGPNGPCGPCSEIYFDPDGKVQGPKSVEVWNLVFTQFDRQPDGALQPLSKPSIDTGMGLERLAAVMQGVATDYETDLFTPIIAAVRRLPRGKTVKPDAAEFSERAIADHARAITLLLSEGLLPSNESRGYVLRMLIRRSYRLARVGFGLPPQTSPELFWGLASAVIEAMAGSPYAEALAAKQDVIRRVWTQELVQFGATLESGTARLEELIAGLKGRQRTISGEEAFRLYDTYGFPLELTVDVAAERGVAVDREGFDRALRSQQERSRAASQFTGEVFATDALRIRQRLTGLPPKDDHFIGYDQTDAEAVIQGLWDGTRWVDEAREEQRVGIVLDHSPFYGEAGGQTGDTGTIASPKGQADVAQTTWADDVLVHHAVIRSGRLKVQEKVQARVDAKRRLRIARSHTATHLLHWALHRVLGPEAVQAGAYNEAERLRFDFSSRQGLQEEERAKVEALVAGCVRQSDAVRVQQMELQAAKQAGAIALFGEKYGARVRVVDIGGYSKELCGGTHLPHTGLVGSFAIVAESSIAAGIRRIEALVGAAAHDRMQEERSIILEAAKRLSRPIEGVAPALEELLQTVKRLERERRDLQGRLAQIEAKNIVSTAEKHGAFQFIHSIQYNADREQLGTMADALIRSLTGDGVVLMASADKGELPFSFVMASTAGAVQQGITVPLLTKEIAPIIDGKGGGRPEFGQGSGNKPGRMREAIERIGKILDAKSETQEQ